MTRGRARDRARPVWAHLFDGEFIERACVTLGDAFARVAEQGKPPGVAPFIEAELLQPLRAYMRHHFADGEPGIVDLAAAERLAAFLQPLADEPESLGVWSVILSGRDEFAHALREHWAPLLLEGQRNGVGQAVRLTSVADSASQSRKAQLPRKRNSGRESLHSRPTDEWLLERFESVKRQRAAEKNRDGNPMPFSRGFAFAAIAAEIGYSVSYLIKRFKPLLPPARASRVRASTVQTSVSLAPSGAAKPKAREASDQSAPRASRAARPPRR